MWRSDVQFAWKHLLCPYGEFLGERRGSLGTEEILGFTLLDSVSHRHLGLLVLALLGLTTLLGVVLVLLCRRLLPGKFTWGSQDRHFWHHLIKLGKSSNRYP